MAFDTLAYAKHLEQAGVERRQAEAHAEAMNQYLRPDLATKSDIAALQTDIAALERSTKSDLAALERSTKSDLAALERSTKSDLAALEQRLEVRFAAIEQLILKTQIQTLGIVAAMLGILFALLRFTGHSA